MTTKLPSLVLLLTLSACTGGLFESANNTQQITGTITYRERILLSPAAEVEIQLLDVSLADVAATVIATTTLQNPGQVPITFSIDYDPADIDERYSYSVRATIIDAGQRIFTTDTAHMVLTREQGTHVDMVLIAMQSNPAHKPNANLTESNWKLVAINEQPLNQNEVAGENKREPHLKFSADNFVVAGFSGCNNFSGTYSLEKSKLTIGPLAMTMMACIEGMDIERAFTTALSEMDRYEIHGNTMLFIKGDAITLRFETN
jgi:putative lipoprotein